MVHPGPVLDTMQGTDRQAQQYWMTPGDRTQHWGWTREPCPSARRWGAQNPAWTPQLLVLAGSPIAGLCPAALLLPFCLFPPAQPCCSALIHPCPLPTLDTAGLCHPPQSLWCLAGCCCSMEGLWALRVLLLSCLLLPNPVCSQTSPNPGQHPADPEEVPSKHQAAR